MVEEYEDLERSYGPTQARIMARERGVPIGYTRPRVSRARTKPITAEGVASSIQEFGQEHPVGGRLRCFEYGATVQAELNFADGIISAIEERAMRRPEILTLPSGESVEARSADIVRIQRETFNDHFGRAITALEKAGPASCGLPPDIVQRVVDNYLGIKKELDAGNYSSARLRLNELRAKLRHPERYFG
jgi:hypothetical protein